MAIVVLYSLKYTFTLEEPNLIKITGSAWLSWRIGIISIARNCGHAFAVIFLHSQIWSLSLFSFYVNGGWYRPLFSVSWIFISCLGEHSCHICKGLTAHSWSWSPFMQIVSHRQGQENQLIPHTISGSFRWKFVGFECFLIHCCVFCRLCAWNFLGGFSLCFFPPPLSYIFLSSFFPANGC